MKRLISAVLAVSLALCFGGCGGSKAETTTADPVEYPVSVGNITLLESPTTAVSLSSVLTELIYELGYGDRLVARTDETTYPEAATTLPTVGSEDDYDLQSILDLQPDLLFSDQSLSSSDMQQLSSAGIQVLICDLPTSFEKTKDLYTMLAQVFAGAITGETLANTAYDAASAALNEVKALLPEETFTFLYLPDSSGNYYDAGDYGADLLTAFGTNVAATVTNIDGAIAADPDIIFLDSPYLIDNLIAEERYVSMRAVDSMAVYTLPEGGLEYYGLRAAEAVKTVAALLYPERFVTEEAEEAA